MPPRIFVSYRRDDAAGDAGRLADHLNRRFGAASVFLDIDTIDPGADFERVLKSSVDQTAALARVPVPVLYLRALHDRVVPRSAWRHVARTRPATHCIALPAPHFLLQVEPLRAAQAIRAFVERLPGRGHLGTAPHGRRPAPFIS